MATRTRTSTANGNGGMNWIRKERRLAIYLRDGLACCYCGAGVEDGAVFTLDHLVPRSDGGTNDTTNLVTACRRCNSARGNRPWDDLCGAVAQYLNHDIDPLDIVEHIVRTVQRPLNMSAAKALMAQRGGFSAALKGA